MRAEREPSSPAPAIVVIIAVSVLVGGLLLLAALLRPGSDPDPPSLEDYDPAAVEQDIADRLEPVRLRPSRQLRLTGRRIVWRDAAGRPFLQTPRVTALIRLDTGPDGGVLISNGVIHQPRLRLVQTGPDRWNYEAPLAPFLGDGGQRDGGSGSGLAVRLRDMAVVDGHVVLDMLEATYEARSLDVRVTRGQLSGPGIAGPTFQVAEAEAELSLPDTATGRVLRNVQLADGRFQLVDGALSFDVDRARFGSSRLADLAGVWDPSLGGYGLDMRLTAVDARVADLPWLRAEVPEDARGSFQLRLEPRPGDRTLVALSELDLSAPGSSAGGSFQVVIGGVRPFLEAVDLRVDPLALDLAEAFTGPLPYAGTVRGTIRGTAGDIRFDVVGRLTTSALADPFTTELSGSVALTEDGFTLHGAEIGLDRVPLGALEAFAPGLPFRGPITGTVRLSGPPGEGPLNLDLRLEAGGGIITISGVADVSGAVPAYDLTGRVMGVELRSVFRPAMPPAAVHAEFALEGRGSEPETAVASLRAHGTFTGWQTEPGDTLIVDATLERGTVDARTLEVSMGPAHLDAAGEWDFVEGSGAVRYEVVVRDVEPLGPYLPADSEGRRRFARGSFELSGTASGTLERPRLSGAVSAEGFRWGEWAAEELAGEYAIVLEGELPRVAAELTGEEVRTPTTDFDAIDLDIDFGAPTFEIALRADQEGGRGVVKVEAAGRIDETGRREVLLRTLEVDLRDQRWRLRQPAEIVWVGGEEIRIHDLALIQVEGDGRIRAEGVLAPADEMDLTLDVLRLPLAEVLRLTGIDLQLQGTLSAEGRVSGPEAAPDLDVEVTLSEGSFRGVEIRSFRSTLRYDRQTLIVDGRGLLGDSAQIRLDGTIPGRIRLGGMPFFELVDDESIDLRIATRTFPLSTLDPGLASAENLQGRLQADLRVEGTPDEPRLSGSAELSDAAVTIPLLDKRFTGIHGVLDLDGREARIRDMVVRSDGRAVITGTMDFQELTNPALDLVAELDKFRVQGVENEKDAGLWGTVRLGGSVSTPVLTGSVRADDGALSLAPLQQPGLSARLSDVGRLDLLEARSELDFDAPTTGGFRIRNLTFEAGKDLWFVTEEARAQLSGTLRIDKAGSSVTIQGTLRGQEGTFELAAGPINRRFQIVSAEIRFFGSPEPNPRLDIVASRLVRIPDGGDVEVEVVVGGTLESPALSLATASGPTIPESELLSFLLFGRPTSDLSQVASADGLGGFLGQGIAYTGIAEVLFSQINAELGFLDYFQLDYLPGGGLYATAGVELVDDLFLSADFPVSAERDISAVGLEYRTGLGTFRTAYEPVDRLDRLVGAQTLSFIEAEVLRQWIVAWRRRWTY